MWSSTGFRLIKEHNDTTDILVSRLCSWGGRKNGKEKLPMSLTCSSGQKIPQILRLQNIQQHKSTESLQQHITRFSTRPGRRSRSREEMMSRVHLRTSTGTIYIRQYYSQEKDITMEFRCDGKCCLQDAKLSLHIVMVHPVMCGFVLGSIKHVTDVNSFSYVSLSQQRMTVSACPAQKSLLKMCSFSEMHQFWGFAFDVHMHRAGWAIWRHILRKTLKTGKAKELR